MGSGVLFAKDRLVWSLAQGRTSHSSLVSSPLSASRRPWSRPFRFYVDVFNVIYGPHIFSLFSTGAKPHDLHTLETKGRQEAQSRHLLSSLTGTGSQCPCSFPALRRQGGDGRGTLGTRVSFDKIPVFKCFICFFSHDFRFILPLLYVTVLLGVTTLCFN